MFVRLFSSIQCIPQSERMPTSTGYVIPSWNIVNWEVLRQLARDQEVLAKDTATAKLLVVLWLTTGSRDNSCNCTESDKIINLNEKFHDLILIGCFSFCFDYLTIWKLSQLIEIILLTENKFLIQMNILFFYFNFNIISMQGTKFTFCSLY